MNKNQKALKNVKAQSKTSATQFDKTALKRLFSYMKEYKRQLVFVKCCGFRSFIGIFTDLD